MEAIDDEAKRMAITIVALNRNFSKPLLLYLVAPKLSAPKALPRPASDLCIKIPITKITESTACM